MAKQTLNLFLGNEGKDKLCPVYLRFREGKETITINLDLRVRRRDWNPKEQALRKGGKGEENQTARHNAYLEEMVRRAEALKHECRLKRTRPSRADFENALFGYSFATETVTQAYAAFLEEKKKQISAASVETYTPTLHKLQEYERANGRLFFPNLDAAFRDGFVHMLSSQDGNNNRTINKKLSQLRTFVYWAAGKGLCEKTAANYLEPLPDVDKTEVYLRQEELRRLEALRTDGTPLHRAREVFLLQCYTGLRFSDAMILQRAHVKLQEGIIHIMNEKTGREVKVPLLPQALEIIKRNGWKLPRIPNSTCNEDVKELCRLAGLNEPVEIVDMKLSRKTRRTQEKWQCVTTHSARDTFATLLVQAGMPIEHVQKLLGHTNSRQTREYDKTTAEDIARALRGK